jgi:transposase
MIQCADVVNGPERLEKRLPSSQHTNAWPAQCPRRHAGSFQSRRQHLKALKATVRGRLLIIWDGLPAHRSRRVRDYVESLAGHIQLERPPAYAPELNPAEYLFGYAKQRELANLCAATIDEVRRYATRRLKSMQRRPKLITAFWQQAELAI